MTKLTSEFISNINKSKQKRIEFISATESNRYHYGDELNITLSSVFVAVAAAVLVGFIYAINLGALL